MIIGQTRQQADDLKAGEYERDKLMKLYGNRFFIDEFMDI
ncbi:hypothetical protein LCGC14_2274030, partial [marine sediment metagenome]